MSKLLIFLAAFFVVAQVSLAGASEGKELCGQSMAEAIDEGNTAQLIIRIGEGCSPNSTYTFEDSEEGEWILPMVVYAVWQQNHEAVKLLIKEGAYVDAADNALEKTALQWAITGIDASCRMARYAGGSSCGRACKGLDTSRCSYYDIVQTLIRAGADVNARNVYNVTPLMQAASNLHRFLVVVDLVEAGADISLRDEQGDTACAYLFSNTEATTPSERSKHKLIQSFVCDDELV